MSAPGAASDPAIAAAGAPAFLSWTLSRYLGRHILLGLGLVVAAFAVLAFLIDSIELLRRAGDREEAGLGVVLVMAFLHLPFLIQAMLPFALLFGAMLTFTRLTRSHELVAARALGVSVWQFLLPAVVIALAIGCFTVTLFNPLAAATFARFEQMEQRYLGAGPSLLALSGTGLWLRQPGDGEDLVLHARQITTEPLGFEQVSVFRYRDEARFAGRIDARSASLEPGEWRLFEATITAADGTSERVASLAIPTELSPDRIQEGFPRPETISFWDLPGYIELMEAIGFSAREHRMYWHGLLSLPLLLSAMLLIGTTFSLRLVRRGGTGLLLAAGLVTGFAFYVLSDIVFAIGLSGRLPVMLAAWTPAGVAILLGLTTLLHLEEG